MRADWKINNGADEMRLNEMAGMQLNSAQTMVKYAFPSVVGLETEGTTSDFQQGATAYLYGTRFVNYLVYAYGYDKLIEFYDRTVLCQAVRGGLRQAVEDGLAGVAGL